MVWGEPPAAERGDDERDGGGLQGEQAPRPLQSASGRQMWSAITQIPGSCAGQ